MILTSSEMQSWLHCHRCWYLGNYRCLRKKSDVRRPLTVGTLYHRAVQEYYTVGERGPHPVDAIRRKATKMIEEHPEFADDIAKDAELAGIMAEGYMEWLEETGADANLEVYGTEMKLDIPFEGTPYILRGKLDARALLRDSGMKVIMETKTCGNLSDLPKTAQTNFQFKTYCLLEYLALLEEGQEMDRTDGVLLRMARKVKRTARAKPPFYGELAVRYNLDELRNHWRNVVLIADEISAARARLDAGEDFHRVVSVTSTRDCFWRDSFAPLCVAGTMDNGSDFEGYIAQNYEQWDPLSRYDDSDEEE